MDRCRWICGFLTFFVSREWSSSVLHDQARFVKDNTMNFKIFKIFILIMFLTGVVFSAGDAGAGGSVTNMRYWNAPDHTRIVFDLTEPPVFETSRLDGTLTVTFRQTTCAESVPRETKIDKSGIGKLTINVLSEGDVLVRMELGKGSEANVFPLKQFLDKPDRLVIDIEFPEVSRQESRMREQIKVSKKKKIIVIDPGHGGDDPGAVGKRGAYEKNVVLAIGRRLKKTLDRHGFFQAYLTRNGDYYVPFNKRLQIAREYGADLFISIHADAAKNRDARGSSVYCLSLGEASSVAAKILAQNENLADIVGGVRDADMKDETNSILINMCQTNTINVSKAFGMSVLWELDHIGELKFDRVQEAPFRVLKMPEIPAVLIETAYISNPDEEKLLCSEPFQKKVSDTISGAVVQFFLKETPGTGTGVLVQGENPKETGGKEALPAEKPVPRPFFLYTVEKGDTLNKIAGRFGVTVGDLLEMNRLKIEDPLYVGKHLKVAGERKDAETVSLKGSNDEKAAGRTEVRDAIKGGALKKTSPPFFFYTVVKGDSLSRIADRFGMSLSRLLEFNQLEMDAPLYVGKRLKIEGKEGNAVKALPKKDDDGKASGRKEMQEPVGKGTAKKTPQPFFFYTVAEGDSLSRIADRFGVSLSRLLEFNQLEMDAPLYVGKRLKIEGKERTSEIASSSGKSRGKTVEKNRPAYKTYRVKKGDTLQDIARKEGVSLAALLKLNRMKLDDPLYKGRVLILGSRNMQ